jgi:hypothetical protein
MSKSIRNAQSSFVILKYSRVIINQDWAEFGKQNAEQIGTAYKTVLRKTKGSPRYIRETAVVVGNCRWEALVRLWHLTWSLRTAGRESAQTFVERTGFWDYSVKIWEAVSFYKRLCLNPVPVSGGSVNVNVSPVNMVRRNRYLLCPASPTGS